MKVAFWSNVRGKSCVTSNLACISVLSALSRPEERTILFENHQNIMNLGSTFFSRNSEQVVKEAKGYTVEIGLGKLLQMVEQGEKLSKESFYSLVSDYLGKRLFYIPSEGVKYADFLEYQMNKECIRTMRYLEHYGDMVFVDTSASPLVSSRKILQQADLVVVNLSQNNQMLDHFFRNYSSIRQKAFYLIGNYDERSELTKGAIMTQYRIPGSRIGTIPHNVQFSDAISEGMIIPFLLKNYSCEKGEANYPFMAAAKEAVELFRRQLECIEGRRIADDEERKNIFSDYGNYSF
ncbi:MAG: hypothetical protein J1F22_04795 [Lachnospiraceae bacterium]|nr:hypothetical protein [Lachnospiraceae bacterium]